MKPKEKSQRQLARELGVSPSYLSQVKLGKRPASHKVLSSPASEVLSRSVKQNMVPRVGFEPTRTEVQRILRATPFLISGVFECASMLTRPRHQAGLTFNGDVWCSPLLNDCDQKCDQN